MATPSYSIEDFARQFLTRHGIRGHYEIRTEVLADDFRNVFGLSPISVYAELAKLCTDLQIPLKPLPSQSGELHAVNVWSTAGRPTIYLRADVPIRRAETNLCHELREIIENALKRADWRYKGLTTSDPEMDRESDQFAGCLLMQARATRDRLKETGYDFALFAEQKERSVSSVLMRSRELYPADGDEPAPIAGLWLFEAPWPKVQRRVVDWPDLVVKYWAHLRGFSMRKRGKGRSQHAWQVFPRHKNGADRYGPATRALMSGHPVIEEPGRLDLFGEEDFVVGAEPFFVDETLWKVLVTAVRKDCLHMVEPWLRRLEASAPVAVGSL